MHGPFASSRLSGAQLPRIAPGSVYTSTAESSIPVACPRCHIALTDPTGIGYCTRCGYCRSSEAASHTAGAAAPLAAEAAARVVTFWRALGHLPDSAWPILLATLMLLPICYFADHYLGPNSRARMLWTFAQVTLGFSVIYAAQIWAFILLRGRRERLGFLDTVFPGKLWRLTIHALPESASTLCLGLCGSVAVLTGIVWIGSWGWLLEIDTTQDIPTTHVADETSDFRHDYKKLKEAANSLRTERDTPISPAPPAAPQRDARPTAQCVVIGYIPDKDGRPASLVLATLRDGKLTYAGTVTSGVGKEEASGLIKKLASLTTKAPLVSDVDVKAIWVRPELFCEVHQSGFNAKGLLVEPRFKAVIED